MSDTVRFHEYRAVPVAPGMRMDDSHTSPRVDEATRAAGPYNIAWTQEAWVITKRAFYNVYPTVVKCLGNSSLKFRLSQLVGFFEPTAICLAQGHELQLEKNVKVSSIIVSIMPFFQMEGRTVDLPICRMVANVIFNDGGNGVVFVEYHGNELLCDIAASTGEEPELLRLCIGVVMLAKDPEFAERILLNRDRKRIDRLDTPEKMQLAVDRAIRNGRNGWTIGEHLEVSPHTRRPHFAIRWTGKGSAIPKLRPVKGCVVKRSKLYPIPTGYMDGSAQ